MRILLAFAAIISLAAATAPRPAPAEGALRCSMALLPSKIVGVIEDTTPRVIRPAPEPYKSQSEEAARFFRDSLLATATTLTSAKPWAVPGEAQQTFASVQLLPRGDWHNSVSTFVTPLSPH